MNRSVLAGKCRAPSQEPSNPPVATASSHNGVGAGIAGISVHVASKAAAEFKRLKTVEMADACRVSIHPNARTSGARLPMLSQARSSLCEAHGFKLMSRQRPFARRLQAAGPPG